MPSIDPRIPLGVQATQVDSPMATLAQLFQLKNLQAQQEFDRERLALTRQQQDRLSQQAAVEAEERQRTRTNREALDRAYSQAVTVDEHGRLKIDRQRLTAHLPGSLIPDVLRELDTDEKSALDIQTALMDLAAKRQKHLGSAAATIRAAGYDPQLFQIQVRGARDLGAIDRHTAERLLALSDPAQIQGVVDSYIQQAGIEEDLAQVETVDAQGRKVTTFVPKRAGVSYPAPPKETTPAAPGTLADFVERYAREQRRPVESLSTTELTRLKAQFEAAGRAPTADPRAAERRAGLVEAVLANPELYDKLTPSDIGDIAPDLAARGFTGFGRRLSDGAIKQMAESRSAIASLRDLRQVLRDNEQYIGPVAGLAAMNPYSKARQAQADIDRVRQRVGKALEGGVLRKEDEEKYKRILATLQDTPATAIYKVDQLIEDIERDLTNFAEEQRRAGRRVSEPTRANGPKVGERRRINGQLAEWDGKGWKAVQ
jgi:hypothetical protein